MTKTARNEKLAYEICEFLRRNHLWMDARIFFNGKALATDNGDHLNMVHRDNGEPFIIENINPCDFFEYAAPPKSHILSMTFEGPLYSALNYGEPNWDIQEKLIAIFRKYDLYYEQGHAWNLTAYES